MLSAAGGRMAVLVVGLALAGCGVSTQDRASVRPDDDVPFALLDPAAPTTTLPPGPAAVRVQLCLHDGTRVIPVAATLESPVRLVDTARALGRSDVAPPGSGLRSALSEPGLVRSVGLTAGVAGVDLSAAFTSLGADDQLVAIAQLVCTLTARPGVGQVGFSLDGVPIDLPRPDGSIAPGPVAREDYGGLIG